MVRSLRNILLVCLVPLFLAACSGPATTTIETTTTVRESATVTATTTTSVTETTTATSSATPSPGLTTAPTITTPRPTATTTTPAYQFREPNPDLPDVKAGQVGSFADIDVPIIDFLLGEDDLGDGITLDDPAQNTVVQMVWLLQAFLEEGGPELLPIVEYNSTFIENGFLRNVFTGSSDGTFQQEIDLISSSESAKQTLAAIREPSLALLRTLFESLTDDFQAETRNVGSAALGQDAWELTVSMKIGTSGMVMRVVAARHENLLSIITVSSQGSAPTTSASTAPRSAAYSADTDEDALSLSELAIARIRAQLQNYRLTAVHDNSRFIGLLNLLPAEAFNGGQDYLTVNDYATLRELTGAIIPDEVTNNTIEDYMGVLYGRDSSVYLRWTGSYLGGHSGWATRGPKAENVGYDLFNVNMEIFNANGALYYDKLPLYVALNGTFNPAASAQAMNDQSAWDDAVRAAFHVKNHDGTAVYSWGNGLFGDSLIFGPPLLDRFGRLFPLAVTENNVFYSDTTDNVFQMLDASLGIAPSLADNSSYVSIAQHMADAGVYSFMIGNEALVNTAAFHVDESDAPLLRPFQDFGVGAGYDDLGPYMVLVLVHEDAPTAEENSRLLIQRVNETWWIRPVDWEQSWREYVDYVLVNVQDNVVTAKLYGDRAGGFWEDWIPEDRPLLLHE